MTQACILMPAVSINVYLFIYLFIYFSSLLFWTVLSTNPKRAETILFSSIICQTIYV